MQYTAYGREQPEDIKVMIDGDTAHIRMTRNYQSPDQNDDQSTGQWEETYQQINTMEAPTKEQIAENENTWWESGVAWKEQREETIEERMEELETENAQLREVIDALIGGEGE